jgi:hypothetical protein
MLFQKRDNSSLVLDFPDKIDVDVNANHFQGFFDNWLD